MTRARVSGDPPATCTNDRAEFLEKGLLSQCNASLWRARCVAKAVGTNWYASNEAAR